MSSTVPRIVAGRASRFERLFSSALHLYSSTAPLSRRGRERASSRGRSGAGETLYKFSTDFLQPVYRVIKEFQQKLNILLFTSNGFLFGRLYSSPNSHWEGFTSRPIIFKSSTFLQLYSSIESSGARVSEQQSERASCQESVEGC